LAWLHSYRWVILWVTEIFILLGNLILQSKRAVSSAVERLAYTGLLSILFNSAQFIKMLFDPVLKGISPRLE